MCGIAGVFGRPHELGIHQFSKAMLDHLSHRGPDDHGWLVASSDRIEYGHLPAPDLPADALLLHSRLSILDLSSSGWQPMIWKDGRYSIVFNGEIYNYIELRSILKNKGYTFRTNTDTEVLLIGYVEWGRGVLDRISGMFAFSILDRTKKQMFVARDFFGIKPLYYTTYNGNFVFASELTALFNLPSISRRAAPQAIYDYLLFGACDHMGDLTFIEGIFQLPAGHYLEISLADPTAIHPKRYWQPPDMDDQVDLSMEEAASRVRELFIESISLHMRSDVPISSALSGGIDSSAITASLCQNIDQNQGLHTFSYVADSASVSEESWIDIVNESFGTTSHKIHITPQEFIRDVDDLIRIQGEPISTTSMYAQYRVYKMIAEKGIKVVLDGQGADEILGGYLYYLGARVTSLFRQKRWYEMVKFLHNSVRVPGVGSNIMLFTGEFLLPHRLQVLPRKLVGASLHPDWLERDWFLDHDVVYKTFRTSSQKQALKEQLQMTLTKTGLPKLLRFQDRNSMAFSIESRVPFLNPKLVDFIFRLPEEYLIDEKGTSKSVFRKAMKGIIPEQILERRDKIGFITPENRWFEEISPWIDDVLNRSSDNHVMTALDHAEILNDWHQIKTHKKPFKGHIWRLINIILWSEKFGIKY